MHRLNSLKRWAAVTGVALVVAIVLTFLPGLLSIDLSHTTANPAFTARTETYVGVASLTTPYDITVTKPPGAVDGDILFCWIGWFNKTRVDSVPSGWILLGEATATADYDRYALYYKIASSEPDSWVWSFLATAKVRAVCSAYAGGDFDPANPIDAVSNTVYKTYDNMCIAASMTVNHINCPLIFWGGVCYSSSKTFTKPSVPTSDWIEDDDAGDTDSDHWAEVCSMIWANSGATGNMIATISASVNAKHAFAVALNPTSAVAPTVTTQTATDVLSTSCTGNGNITATGGANATRRGFCYMVGTSGDPTTANSTAYDDGSYGTGTYTKAITGLSPGTSYRIRAYAVSSGGTGYGDTVQILTIPAAPTNVAASDGTSTENVTITWTKSIGATGYKVYEDSNLLDTLGDVDTYDDITAPAPTITNGTTVASDGLSTAYVALSLNGTSANNGTPRTYKVTALDATGDSADSDTDTGFVGIGALAYQWQKSDADSDDDYSNIDDATNSTYDDTNAPEPTITPGTASATDGSSTSNITLSISGESANDGDGRYYQCELTADGAASQNSTADRGYRDVGNPTYQWYVSNSTADEGFSLLDDATTDPYEDATAPAATITEGTATATDGSSTTLVSLEITGESTTDGEVRYYYCTLSATGAPDEDTNHDDGYTGVGSLTYQWQRSSTDFDGNYTNIIGATGTTYDDTNAPAPTITVGNATAADGVSRDYVTIDISGESSNDGDGRYYQCYLTAEGAASDNSTSDRGYRGTTTLTYQWQRSTADLDDNYSDIGGATDVSYNDTAGVIYPDGRYYKCAVNMTGATSQNSTSDRGYKLLVEPVVVTNNTTDIDYFMATLAGNVTDTGGRNSTVRGFEWGLSVGNYTSSWNETGDFGAAEFSYNLTNLTCNVTYYYRAFAVNPAGTGYGDEVNFTTLEAFEPTVETNDATDIGDYTATISGNLTNTGGPDATLRGFEWDDDDDLPPFTYSWNETGTYGIEEFTHNLTSLLGSKTYWFRTFAVGCGGIGYGNVFNFTTTLPLPFVPTNFTATQTGVSNITLNWTKGLYATHTIIVISEDHPPIAIDDGYVVYNNTSTSTNIDGLNLGGSTYFIGVWSYNPTGYSIDHVSTNIGGSMIVMAIVGIICIGALAVGFAFRQPLILICAGIGWVVFGALMFTSSPGDFGTPLFVLGLAFALVCFVWPLVIWMRSRTRASSPEERDYETYKQQVLKATHQDKTEI